jgi:hypothetical protein
MSTFVKPSYIDFFNNNSNINAIASNGYCIDEQSKIHEKYAVWDAPHFLREQNIPFNFFSIICNVANVATGATMAIRKEIIPDIVPFPIIPDFHHDEWIAIITSKTNSFELLNEKYFYYRTHKNQQVGGVFFNKTNEVKRGLIEIFNISQEKATYISFKRKLKRICYSYIRNQRLLHVQSKHKELFLENLIQIENNFYETKSSCFTKLFEGGSVLTIPIQILQDNLKAIEYQNQLIEEDIQKTTILLLNTMINNKKFFI